MYDTSLFEHKKKSRKQQQNERNGWKIFELHISWFVSGFSSVRTFKMLDTNDTSMNRGVCVCEWTSVKTRANPEENQDVGVSN